MAPDNHAHDQGQRPGTGSDKHDRFVFPKWTNRLREAVAVAALGGVVYLVVLVAGVFSPQNSAIGYAPVQPVPYSHALHAGELGIDCRYCHASGKTGARANVPPTATCMNCHKPGRTTSEQLTLVRHSAETSLPIHRVRAHARPLF